MKRERIAVSFVQISFLAAVFLVPLFFSLILINVGENTSRNHIATIMISIIGGLAIGLIWSIVGRRSILLHDSKLIIDHSFYTVELSRNQVRSIEVEKMRSTSELRISTKKNGIAGFGFLSGWFYGDFGDLVFCAVSKRPFYVATLNGAGLKFQKIALSCTDEMAKSIADWPL
jgi:hypothetical protein